MSLLSDIKDAQPVWFSRENKSFANDVAYLAYKGKQTGKPYLVRSTYGFTDMFDKPKRLHWKINKVDSETLKIKKLVDGEFASLDDVKEWLKEN